MPSLSSPPAAAKLKAEIKQLEEEAAERAARGEPEPEAQHAAYGALVVTQKRAGMYSMPCAAGASASLRQTSGKEGTFMT